MYRRAHEDSPRGRERDRALLTRRSTERGAEPCRAAAPSLPGARPCLVVAQWGMCDAEHAGGFPRAVANVDSATASCHCTCHGRSVGTSDADRVGAGSSGVATSGFILALAFAAPVCLAHGDDKGPKPPKPPEPPSGQQDPPPVTTPPVTAPPATTTPPGTTTPPETTPPASTAAQPSSQAPARPPSAAGSPPPAAKPKAAHGGPPTPPTVRRQPRSSGPPQRASRRPRRRTGARPARKAPRRAAAPALPRRSAAARGGRSTSRSRTAAERLRAAAARRRHDAVAATRSARAAERLAGRAAQHGAGARRAQRSRPAAAGESPVQRALARTASAFGGREPSEHAHAERDRRAAARGSALDRNPAHHDRRRPCRAPRHPTRRRNNPPNARRQFQGTTLSGWPAHRPPHIKVGTLARRRTTFRDGATRAGRPRASAAAHCHGGQAQTARFARSTGRATRTARGSSP